MNQLNVRRITPYMIIGSVMWYGFFRSGIHATIAGVLLAMTIPATIKIDHIEFRTKSSELIHDLIKITDDQQISPNELPLYMNAISELEHSTQDVSSPLQRLEHSLAPYVIFIIMPIFALANAGVVLSADRISSLSTPVSLGIFFGLVIGKPVGIFMLSYLAVKINLARLPPGLNWMHILGLGFLAGIGFTMSTFISALAFETNPTILEVTKLSILIASFSAAIIGYAFLRYITTLSEITQNSSKLTNTY